MSKYLQNFLAGAAKKAAVDLEAALLQLPEYKRGWSPAETSRSAVDQVAECAMLNGMTVQMITSRAWPADHNFEQYLKENPNVDESKVQVALWSTLYGRKMFSVGFTNASDGSKEQSIYLFSDKPTYDHYATGHVDVITIYPDTQENHPAFEQVVNYYAQTLPMISRTETVAACKSINLPPRKEYDMTADPETGYVTVIYHDASGTEQHVFFNYRDDSSQCTPSVKALLKSIKGTGETLLP